MTTDRPDKAGTVACRICGSTAVRFRGARHGDFLKRNFNFWHCPACDFMFVDPFPGFFYSTP